MAHIKTITFLLPTPSSGSSSDQQLTSSRTHLLAPSHMRTVSLPAAASAPASLAAQHQPTTPQQRSPWQSPVPYLFGGLGAVLGLTFLAVLILACARLKPSRYMESANNGGGSGNGLERAEAGAAKVEPWNPLGHSTVLVIMAGDEKPTFLATPLSNLASSSSDGHESKVKAGDEEDGMEGEETQHTEAAPEGRRGRQQEGM